MTFTEHLANKYKFDLNIERGIFLTNSKEKDKHEQESIINLIMRSCELTKIPFGKLISVSRVRDIVEVRHVLMYIIFNRYPGITLKKIGSYFGGRDHSSVIHAVEKVTNMLEIRDKRIIAIYNLLNEDAEKKEDMQNLQQAV